MIPNRARQSRPRAFTLIELILALGLTVVVATILTSATFIAFHTKDTINNALDVARSGDPAAMLEHELAYCISPTPNPADAAGAGLTVTGLGPSAIASTNIYLIGPFEGMPDNVDFFTTGAEPKADLQPDIHEVQYALVPDPNGNDSMLVRRVTTNLLAVDTSVVPPDEVVCRHVLNFSLQYSGDGSTWVDTWDSTAQTDTLPLMVQFTLEIAPRYGATQSTVETRYIPLICAQPAPAATSTTGATP